MGREKGRGAGRGGEPGGQAQHLDNGAATCGRKCKKAEKLWARGKQRERLLPPGCEEKFAKDLDLNQALGYILKKKIGGRMENAPSPKV